MTDEILNRIIIGEIIGVVICVIGEIIFYMRKRKRK